LCFGRCARLELVVSFSAAKMNAATLSLKAGVVVFVVSKAVKVSKAKASKARLCPSDW
jgi:hypothetical protein